jgi:hypothetical protein
MNSWPKYNTDLSGNRPYYERRIRIYVKMNKLWVHCISYIDKRQNSRLNTYLHSTYLFWWLRTYLWVDSSKKNRSPTWGHPYDRCCMPPTQAWNTSQYLESRQKPLTRPLHSNGIFVRTCWFRVGDIKMNAIASKKKERQVSSGRQKQKRLTD